MNIEKNNEILWDWALDKKKLLEELAIDIAKEFWLEKEKAQELIKKETLEWIKYLKNELNNETSEEKNKLSDKEVEKLFFTLKWALDIIENYSKLEIKTLKEDVEKSINIEDFKNPINMYLPPRLVNKAQYPSNPHEHILGFALWSANSIFTTVDILYKIWKWILQTPYHLYMIMSWKSETDSFKNI